MSFSVHDTTEWTWEQVQPYWLDLLAAMEKLVARFPSDTTVPALIKEWRQGKRTVFFILEDGKFVSFAMASIQTILATGEKIATLSDLAGERVDEYAEQLCEAIEAWADAKGGPGTIKAVEGRDGWKPLLRKFGYRPYAVIYRKVA